MILIFDENRKSKIYLKNSTCVVCLYASIDREAIDDYSTKTSSKPLRLLLTLTVPCGPSALVIL